MMFNSAISESSDVRKVLSISGENPVEGSYWQTNGRRYKLLATQKASQAPHRVRDPTGSMTKEALARLQRLRCKHSQTSASATTEIFFDRSTSQNITLTSEESVTLSHQPLVEVVQNAA